jgi:putative thioredoxin
MALVDASDQSFEADVLERSRELPVVVDFWAEWCAPCRQLGPLLEQAVADRDGKIELVKIDVDRNPRSATRYRVHGIPAVKAFRDGRLVDEFTGLVPRAVLDRFLDRLLPSEAELLAARGDEESLRRALELEPGNAGLRGRLALLELSRENGDPRLAGAAEALADGDQAAALEALLSALEAAPGERRERIREAMVGLFAELGQDHPLSRTYRRRLAAALY